MPVPVAPVPVPPPALVPVPVPVAVPVPVVVPVPVAVPVPVPVPVVAPTVFVPSVRPRSPFRAFLHLARRLPCLTLDLFDALAHDGWCLLAGLAIAESLRSEQSRPRRSRQSLRSSPCARHASFRSHARRSKASASYEGCDRPSEVPPRGIVNRPATLLVASLAAIVPCNAPQLLYARSGRPLTRRDHAIGVVSDRASPEARGANAWRAALSFRPSGLTGKDMCRAPAPYRNKCRRAGNLGHPWRGLLGSGQAR